MEPTIEELNASLTKQVGELNAKTVAFEAVIKGKDESLAAAEAKVKELSESVALLSREKQQIAEALKAAEEKQTTIAKEAAKVAASVGVAPIAASATAPVPADRTSILEEFTRLQRNGKAAEARKFYNDNRDAILGR